MTAAPPLPRRHGLRRWRALGAVAALLVLGGCAAGASANAGASSGSSAAASAVAVGAPVDPDAREWIPLFNGRDLTGWTVKFRGHDPGVNLHDTFRVENGHLVVRYDRWPAFDGEFGHLFHERPFSHYVLRAEYRFVGEQVAGAGAQYGWAVRNNGLMLHAQSARSMGRDQDFPISLEVQLLGGLGDGRARSTANLCTPGTHVVVDDTLVTRHCIDSSSPTFDGDRWVRVEVMVLGDSLVRHIVEGDTVLTYRAPRMGGGNVSGLAAGAMREGTPLRDGYIALQAESAPTEFRSIELLDLVGCMDPRASNFKRYLVRADPAACRYAGGADRR